MSSLSKKQISDIMKHIDICMMTTIKADSTPETRPMSNNREVDYQGTSYFFAYASSSAVQQITAKQDLTLSYIGHHSFLNRSSIYITLEGKANLITDKAIFKQHWHKELDLWFKDGINTPGLTLIEVKGKKVSYWDGYEHGEIPL